MSDGFLLAAAQIELIYQVRAIAIEKEFNTNRAPDFLIGTPELLIADFQRRP